MWCAPPPTSPQVKALEAQLDECGLRKQLAQMQKQLDLLEEEKRETEVRLQEEEKKKTSLESRGEVTHTHVCH